MKAVMGMLAAVVCVAGAAVLAGCDQKAPAPGGKGATGPSQAGGGGGGGRMKIAVIPKGTTHVFWKGVERGAKKAGDELGVDILWKGPATENDRSQQIQLVQQFVTDKVSAIVLAPLDDTALLAPVKAATAAGIPVAIVDSGLKGEAGADYIGYYGTDNKSAGKVGGAALAKLVGKDGKAVVLRYNAGSASTGMREEGGIEGLKEGGAAIISDNQEGGVTPESAKTKALQMMDTIKGAAGVYTVNESTTLGMLLALRQAGLAGKVKFIGFDASPPLVEALRKGEIDGLVVQNPEKMGEVGVRQAVRKLKGETPEKLVDTGAVLVTKENMDSAEVKGLLPPE